MNGKNNSNNRAYEILDMLQATHKDKSNANCSRIVLPLIVFLCVVLTVIVAFSIHGNVRTTSAANKNRIIVHNSPNNQLKPKRVEHDVHQSNFKYYTPHDNNGSTVDDENGGNKVTGDNKEEISSADKQLMNQGIIALNNKDYNQAIVLFNRYLKKHPDDIAVNNYISTAYDKIGNKELADKYYQIAKDLDGE